MITFEQLKQKGYIIEVNTTGAMIVDTIDADDIPLTSLQEATYTQKNIIYDNCEQTYDLVDVSTNDIVYSANDIDDLIQEINKRLKENTNLANEQLNNLKWILEFAIVNEVIDFEKYNPDTLNISDTEAAKRTANDIRKIINIIEENSTKED